MTITPKSCVAGVCKLASVLWAGPTTADMIHANHQPPIVAHQAVYDAHINRTILLMVERQQVEHAPRNPGDLTIRQHDQEPQDA